jgi:hypothetical protein
MATLASSPMSDMRFTTHVYAMVRARLMAASFRLARGPGETFG